MKFLNYLQTSYLWSVNHHFILWILSSTYYSKTYIRWIYITVHIYKKGVQKRLRVALLKSVRHCVSQTSQDTLCKYTEKGASITTVILNFFNLWGKCLALFFLNRTRLETIFRINKSCADHTNSTSHTRRPWINTQHDLQLIKR